MIFSKPSLTLVDKTIIIVLVVSAGLGTLAPRLVVAVVLAFPFGVLFGWAFKLWPRVFAHLRPEQCKTGLPICFVAYAPSIATGEFYRLASTTGVAHLALMMASTTLGVVCLAAGVKELLEPGAVTKRITKWWAEYESLTGQRERAANHPRAIPTRASGAKQYLRNLSVFGCVLGFLANAAWAVTDPSVAPVVLLATVATVVLLGMAEWAPPGWHGLTAYERWCMKRFSVLPIAAITALAFGETALAWVVPHGFLVTMLCTVLPMSVAAVAYLPLIDEIWGRAR